MSSHKFASSFGCLDAWMLRFRCRDLRFPVSVGVSFSISGCFVFETPPFPPATKGNRRRLHAGKYRICSIEFCFIWIRLIEVD